MLKITLRELWAHKVRLVMSTLAIVLGVAFLAGVLVFTHGIGHTFDGIINGSTPDARVRAQGAKSFSQNRTATVRLHPADLTRLRGLKQVGRADPEISGADLHLLDRHGDLLESSGAPTLAFNHNGARNLLGRPMLDLHGGHWPRTTSEITLDPTTAAKAGYHVGDTVTVLEPGGETHERLRLSGLASFSGGSGTAGSQLVLFSTAGAQKMFLGGRDEYTGVALTAAPGVSRAALAKAADRVVPQGFEAVSGDTVVKESDDAVNSLLSVITTFLVVFAVIAVIVGGFIIINTFSILIAQRSRELALLRALGASRRQVTTSVLVQALVMALVASTIGIVTGWAIAHGLAAVSRRFGFDISASALTLTPRTVWISYAVGVGVTLVAALLPSRRAAKVPPVAAMRADHQPRPRTMAWRTTIGIVLLIAGIGAAVWATGRAPAVFGRTLPPLPEPPGNNAIWVGVGAGVSILTVAAISASIGRPVLVVLRTLAGLVFRMPGRLAGENALRDPRRTGATASALMIGLALVSLIGVLAASMNASIADVVNKQFNADFIVSGATGSAFPTSVGDKIARTSGVMEVSRMQYAQAILGKPPRIDPRNPRKPIKAPPTETLVGIDAATTHIYPVDVRSGSADLARDGALVTSREAHRRHWRLGQQVTFTFAGDKELHTTITGIMAQSDVLGPVNVRLVDLASVTPR
ncbi:MAG: ABC transporter permease, partial [Nocardioides sp.]|nr:ABC transporter permease [Nocardioides sp.]